MNDPAPPDLRTQLARMLQTADEIRAELRHERFWRRVLLAVIGVLVLVIAGGGTLAYVGYDANRERARENRDITELALCPLFRLFIDAYDPARQPAERRERYRIQFGVIFNIHDNVLDCRPTSEQILQK